MANVATGAGNGGVTGSGGTVLAGKNNKKNNSLKNALPGSQELSGDVRGLFDKVLGNDFLGGGETGKYQDIIDRILQGDQGIANLTTGKLADQGMAGAKTGAKFADKTAGSGFGFSQAAIPYAEDLMKMGMDPQNALYDRTLHDITEQQRAGQAARGLEMSPFAAGLEADATKNFNIDWQNTQLDRAVKGAEGGAALARSGFDMGTDASKLAASGALLPYSTKMGFLTDKTGAQKDQLGAYEREADFGTRSNQVTQQAITDMLQYLGMGPGYQSAATSQQQQDSSLGNSLITSIVPGLFAK